MARKLLIVDDEPLNRELLAGFLAHGDYELLEAGSAREARRAVYAARPDLILLDVIMPEEDGFSLCKFFKEQYQESFLPIILVTALEDRNSRLTGLECGADDFLSKPVDRFELAVKVRNMLKIRDLHLNLYNELLFAQRVQENLFLANNILRTGDKIYYHPCRRIGGDLIEVWERAGTRWALLADASGHGPSAALIAAAVKALVPRECTNPAALLAELNARLVKLLGHEGSGYFVTAACLKLEAGRLEFAGAGHPPVYLSGQGQLQMLESLAMPLGILEEQQFTLREFACAPGQVVMMYSDGLLDSLSEEELQAMLESGAAAAILDQELRSRLQMQNCSDDIAYLLLAI